MLVEIAKLAVSLKIYSRNTLGALWMELVTFLREISQQMLAFLPLEMFPPLILNDP